MTICFKTRHVHRFMVQLALLFEQTASPVPIRLHLM